MCSALIPNSLSPASLNIPHRVRPHSPVTDIFWLERSPTSETLRTRVTVVGEAMGMSLVQTETFSGEEKIAGGQIKIFIVD